jgi:hypothetical protein
VLDVSAAAILVCSALGSLALIIWCDRLALRQGVPTLGLVVVGMYISTYGVGWLLWRLDPSSLFGAGSRSTLGALEGMGGLFAVGLSALSVAYVMVRRLLAQGAWRAALRPPQPFLTLARRLTPRPQRLCLLLVALAVLGLMGMASQGVFLRDPELQRQAMQSSWLAKILVGSALLSRLAPVGLVLVPLAWPSWSRPWRGAVIATLAAWLVLAFNSGSRGQLFAVPLYLTLGAVLWRVLSWRRAVAGLLLAGLLAWPTAEWMRVHRAGPPANANLTRTFEIFQTGRQLMGTSHELYLMLRPRDCASDLEKLLKTQPQAAAWLRMPLESLAEGQKYHVARLYDACQQRSLALRQWAGFERLPAGLLPSTFLPTAPSLFDGQQLVEQISQQLRLKPGEISHGTLSLFADAWWRFRWPGIVLMSGALGAALAMIQSVLLILQGPLPLVALLGQLLALSLIGSWINNTALTMVWLLAWDLPKALFELWLLALFVAPRRREEAPA